jgi:hypothetical protein
LIDLSHVRLLRVLGRTGVIRRRLCKSSYGNDDGQRQRTQANNDVDAVHGPPSAARGTAKAYEDHWLPAFKFNVEEWFEGDRYGTPAI